jgi:ribonuclease VapC
MIVVDPSALLAIVFDEPERDALLSILDSTDSVLMSSASVIEARMVAYGRYGHDKVLTLDELIASYSIAICPPDPDEVEIAHKAFVVYGKGSGHPAQLNFGDLFSYALAKSRGVPLLFKGDDFSQTDILAAS